MKLFHLLKRHGFLFLLIAIVIGFFYKSIFLGQIPFPGDLLVSHQEPYRSYSFLGFDPGGIPHKAQGPDVIKQLLPWKHFTIETLKQGQIPLWNPYNFSGNPHMANFQSGVFYPGNLIFFLFNFSLSWTLFILLSPLLSAVFTYFFLSRLKLSPAACVLGAISFSFSLYMTVWMEYGNIGHTFAFLPLALYFTDKLVEKIGYKTFLGLILTLFLSILAGYIQGAFYIYLVAFSYFIFKSLKEKKVTTKKLMVLLTALTIPVGLSAMQILPTLELFANSTRENYTILEIQKLLNPIWYLVTVVAPDFFGNPASRNYWLDGTYIERVSYFGLIPLIFAFYAIKSLRLTEVKFFSFVFILALILATDLVFTKVLYSIPIPVLSTTVPTRLLSVFTFAGSILAAYGFENLLAQKNKKDLIIVLTAIFVFITCLLGFTFLYPKFNIDQSLALNLNTSFKNLILPFTSVLVLSVVVFFYYFNPSQYKKYKKTLLITFVIGLVSFDLFFYFHKITPFSPREFLYPSTPVTDFLKQQDDNGRYWGYGSAIIESNIGSVYKLYSPEGNDPLHIREYTELVESSDKGKLPDNLGRPDALLPKGYGKIDITASLFRQKVLNIAGVKYIFNKDESINGNYNPDFITFPEDKFKLAFQNGYWQIYENLNALPRAFVTNKYDVVEGNAEALSAVYSSGFNEKESIILYDDPQISDKSDLVSSASIVEYRPNTVRIKADTNKDALLFLSDTFYPGWKAYVNGSETKIYNANYAFRAVNIPEGASEVVFDYQPESFKIGTYISALSVLLLVFALILVKKYEK